MLIQDYLSKRAGELTFGGQGVFLKIWLRIAIKSYFFSFLQLKQDSTFEELGAKTA